MTRLLVMLRSVWATSRQITRLLRVSACAVRMESTVMEERTEEILVDRKGPLLFATLNRPKALNALSKPMVANFANYLRDWDREESDVRAVLVKGAGGKAFCAGGDVKTVVLSETVASRLEFFQSEYRMNYVIAKMQKPIISLMDGIVMGGGCGIAMHTPFRIATERTLCAMPECVIGFNPDVGASYFLNRLPDTIGAYMGITGKRVRGLELKAVGLATHFIASEHMPIVVEKLEALGEAVRDHSLIDATLKQLEVPDHLKEMQPLYDRLAKIGQIFNPFESSLDSILSKLQSSEDEDAKEALQNILNGSPLSVALTYELLKRTAGQSLKSCLETEFSVATSLCRGEGDFFEGVRALLIDKDKNPKWKFQSSQVTPELVDSFFQRKEGDPTLFGPTSRL